MTLNNVCMEESNDPVNGDKDEREHGVVHQGEPEVRINGIFFCFNFDTPGTRVNLGVQGENKYLKEN